MRHEMHFIKCVITFVWESSLRLGLCCSFLPLIDGYIQDKTDDSQEMLISAELCVWTELFKWLYINSEGLFYSCLCGWPGPKPMNQIVAV